jgi:hypothetical protein
MELVEPDPAKLTCRAAHHQALTAGLSEARDELQKSCRTAPEELHARVKWNLQPCPILEMRRRKVATLTT